MINVDYKGVEIGELSADTSASFVPGRAVGISSASLVQGPTGGARILGLVKEWLYSGVKDEVQGENSQYGSGKCTVLMSGIATIAQETVDGTSYNAYLESATYSVNDRLYATASTGVVTNSKPSSVTYMEGLTDLYIGRVLTAPTNPANGDPMQVTVACLG